MSASETFPYTLPSGATVEIENMPDMRRGPQEVSRVEKTPISFEAVVQPLGEVSELLFDKLKTSVTAPEEIKLEFGASLKGQSSLVIVSGGTEATIKVTLTWTKSG
jgi:inner membrane protein involved in colicin E2 resistance